MAILRGGRRIGPFDIRLGLPRDKSLDNVQGDKRLGRQMLASGKDHTIGRVLATIAEGEGFAKANRFMVDFILPRGVDAGGNLEEEIRRSTTGGDFNTGVQRGLRAFVESVEMPGRNLDTVTVKTYGPERKVVNGHSFGGTMTLSVYGDKYLRQRSFFEIWQKAAFDQGTNNVHFYDEYTGGMRIYQLGAFDGNQDRDRITYGVEVFECFPKTIGPVTYDQGAGDITKISVTMDFRYWYNLTIDQISNYTTGGGFKAPTVEEAQSNGLIGGLLDKLPPVLKRPARDAYNVIKQRVPIGAVTGGRVFPPFL